MNNFEKAQEMKKKYPGTFDAPTPAELDSIEFNDYVKVCAGSERFWITVKGVEDDVIYGMVNNDLVCTFDHGLHCGDSVKFKKCHVYNIMKG